MAANTKFAVGIHILSVLALKPNELMSSDYIAGSVNTNPVVVRRLLSDLVKNGLVDSQRGVNGGFRLKKDPQAIRLAEVYQAVEVGELFALHPHPQNPLCPVSRNIRIFLKPILVESEQAALMVLANYSLFDLLQPLLKVD